MMRGCTHAEARENTVNAGTANALRRRRAAAPAGARGGGPGNARGAAAAGEGGGTLKTVRERVCFHASTARCAQ